MISFEYYCEEFGGSMVDCEEEFERLCDKGCRFVTYICCTAPDFEDEDVKSCVCALVDVYAQNSSFLGIMREHSEDYEEEYNGISDELMHTAKLYLPPLMLHRGL